MIKLVGGRERLEPGHSLTSRPAPYCEMTSGTPVTFGWPKGADANYTGDSELHIS